VRASEREMVCVCERERDEGWAAKKSLDNRERECVCVKGCVYVREREREV